MLPFCHHIYMFFLLLKIVLRIMRFISDHRPASLPLPSSLNDKPPNNDLLSLLQQYRPTRYQAAGYSKVTIHTEQTAAAGPDCSTATRQLMTALTASPAGLTGRGFCHTWWTLVDPRKGSMNPLDPTAKLRKVMANSITGSMISPDLTTVTQA